MPSPPLPAISSSPTNTFGLAQYLAQRLPGYDFSEYVREINAAYIHVWEEISKLKNQYFTNVVTTTVTAVAQEFDLLYNNNGNLSNAISSRLYQVTRIRVLPPNSNFGTTGLWQTCYMTGYNDPDYVTIEAQASPTAATMTGPYYFILHGHGSIRSAIPLAAGTMLEITYTYWPIALSYMTSNSPASSSIASLGNVVTGASTTFTQIVPPDFQSTLPVSGVVNEEAMQAELVCNSGVPAGGQVYRVAAINSDTSLTTITPISPVLPGSNIYVLAAVPEIPREHIRVIASVALAKMFSVDGDDQRITEWTAIAASSMQMMKDSLIERQSNNPPKKQRFQYGVGRRNRAFLR